MFDLRGITALVTGASSGIGTQIARTLHAQGAIVTLHGTRLEALEDLAVELGGERVHIVTASLNNPQEAGNLVADAEALMGSVDVLVNNAGITRDTLLMRMKDADWDDVMMVNLRSIFVLSRAVMKGMMKRRWGRIINMTSIVGVTGNAGQTNYAASKAGIIGFSKSLAAEVASRNITVNCIAPGFIATPMTDVLTDDQKAKIVTTIPTGRLGTADDIAAAVVFLASTEAAYVTGQTLHVNGGMAMI